MFEWIGFLTDADVHIRLVTGRDGIVKDCCSLSTIDQSENGEDWAVEGVGWLSTCPMTSGRRERRLSLPVVSNVALTSIQLFVKSFGKWNSLFVIHPMWTFNKTAAPFQTTRSFRDGFVDSTPNDVTTEMGLNENVQSANDQISWRRQQRYPG